jgi:hypothetical protein
MKNLAHTVFVYLFICKREKKGRKEEERRRKWGGRRKMWHTTNY